MPSSKKFILESGRASQVRIEIIEHLQAVEKLRGVAVILDVFRASNTIIALLDSGVSELVLLSDLEEARRLKARRPGWLLLGERHGITPPDFDGGNSPAEAASGAFSGRRVILTTSAGTQAVGRLGAAQAVFFGSFANAHILSQVLRGLAPQEVHLLPMGLEALEPALEDQLAAGYLAQLLAGCRLDFSGIRSQLLGCNGAQRLRSLEQHADLDFCTALDSHRVIPQVRYGELPRVEALAQG